MKKKPVIAMLLLTSMLAFAACGQAQENTAQSAEISQAPDEAPAASEAAAASEVSQAATSASSAQTVTVNSTEKVNIVPDIAEIVYSIRTQDTKAADCQQQNSENVDNLVALLKDLGVAENSIQTTGYYLNPRYDWSSNQQKLIGYEAVTTLTVSDLPIDRTGAILAHSVNAGVNEIDSISYLSSQYDEAYAQALSLAVSAALAKADAMAQAAGYELGGVASMQEVSTYSQARYQDNVLRESSKAEGFAAEDVTVMPGELEISASVMVEYTLN